MVFKHVYGDTHLEVDANESQIDLDSQVSSLAQIKQWTQTTCTKGLLKRRLPFLQWAPTYTFKSIFHDCIAGFTVALTAIPQGIAYGAVAGLPVQVNFFKFSEFIDGKFKLKRFCYL